MEIRPVKYILDLKIACMTFVNVLGKKELNTNHLIKLCIGN